MSANTHPQLYEDATKLTTELGAAREPVLTVAVTNVMPTFVIYNAEHDAYVQICGTPSVCMVDVPNGLSYVAIVLSKQSMSREAAGNMAVDAFMSLDLGQIAMAADVSLGHELNIHVAIPREETYSIKLKEYSHSIILTVPVSEEHYTRACTIVSRQAAAIANQQAANAINRAATKH